MNFSSDDPKVFGPETWEVGHSQSIHAKTKNDATHFINVIWRNIVNDIRCTHCRSDALAYLNSHPFTYRDELSAFRYIYDMHEYVNAKLGKKGITFAAAVEKYTAARDPKHCSTACANTADPVSSNGQVSRTNSSKREPSLTVVNLGKTSKPSVQQPSKVTIQAASTFAPGNTRIVFGRH